jgi:hypothetical protein
MLRRHRGVSFIQKVAYTNLIQACVEVLHILFNAINIHYFKTVFNGLDALICDVFTNVALRTEHSKNLSYEFHIPGDDPFEALCVLLPYNKTGETPLFPAILPIERQNLLFRLFNIFKR